MIGCPGVSVNGSELTHQNFEFSDHEATVKSVEAVHEVANVLRYLDLEAHKVDVEKMATHFKRLHEVHDHLHTHAHLVPVAPGGPAVQLKSLQAALDLATSK
jgi:hypothetical protein